MTPTASKLPPVTEEQRDRLYNAPRNAESHKALLNDTAAMNTVQVGGQGSMDQLTANFGIGAWNVERGLFPQKTGERLAPFSPQIVLLSEVDNGMARTQQINTTAEIAKVLGMHYAYGVEFYEMGLGGGKELELCVDDHNTQGFHGNAILSSAPFEKVGLFRLDDRGHWFSPARNAGAEEQPRLGERMAVAAIVPTEKGPICVVSTHLESNGDEPHRHMQFESLLNQAEAFAPELPILVGGDLNTGNHLPPDFDWKRETLFDMARERGYSWDLSPDGVTTRASLITPHTTRQMKLDWFCSRGFAGDKGHLIEALDPEGLPLSDHECIFANVRVLAP